MRLTVHVVSVHGLPVLDAEEEGFEDERHHDGHHHHGADVEHHEVDAAPIGHCARIALLQ